MKHRWPARWILGGWLVALLASAIPALWMTADLVDRNPLGKFVDPASGAWAGEVYWQFFRWWLPVAGPVGLLALASMFVNRRAD